MDIDTIIENLKELDHAELLQIEVVARALRRKFIPFRIKRKYKRCGKPGCPCADGPSNNSWGNLHGPYLLAQYRDGNKTRQVSLGREYDADEIKELSNLTLPKWYDYVVTGKQYEKMSDDRKYETYERSLSDGEFEAKYGFKPEDDTFGRPRKLRYDRRKWKTEYEKQEKQLKVTQSKWSKYGVGTYNGIVVLDGLEKKGFYLKD